MSPDKYNKLIKLRKKLDKLDDSLIKIIKKRTSIVKQVLQLKEYKNQIIDNKRISLILSQIKKKSINNNIDPKITRRIWINMIRAYIDYEKRNFNKK
jgi:Chorismate mutase|tara:strand:- start:929 stop:1219 length:291 start_codon:yes stop_codon:yes gene_type:complete